MVRKLLVILALSLPGVAHAEWHEASSKHFVVYADDTLENIREYTERLERFDKAIRVFRQAPRDKRGPAGRVTVFVADNIEALQKLYGTSSTGVAGFYRSAASGPAAFVPRRAGTMGDYGISAQGILFHEYAHHWMLTNWSDAALPPWFVEGFAEFHATAQFRRDGSVVFGAAPMIRQYTGMSMNLLPAKQLLRPDPGKLQGPEADALYSRGWLLTHYLTFDEERRKQLADYIVAVNSGKKIEDAMSILGDVGTLDMKLNGYAKRAALPSATIGKEELEIGEIKVRPLTPGEAATITVRMASTRGVDDKLAPRVADLARRLAAPYPNDAGAQRVLAEAEYDAASFLSGEQALALYAAAEAAADRAIAADPRNVHAYVYKAKARLAAAEERKVTDPAVWTEARKPLLAANRIDPEDPFPLAEFYSSFEAAGQKPSNGAEAGLVYAYALAPYDFGLRMSATKLFLQQGKVAEARTAMTPVAYYRDRGQPTLGQKVLAALDEGGGGAPAALKLIEEAEQKAKEARDKVKKEGDEARGDR